MFYKYLGLLFLYGMIIFTVMQENTIIWITSAFCSIILMHFISKWLKLGGLSQLGLQMQKGWLRFLFFGCLIGIGYQLLRFSIISSTGMITLHEISLDMNSLIISTVILLVSTAYIGFAEEIVFRGYLINMLPSSFSNKSVVVISSIFFAFAHLINGNFDILRMVELLFVGLFLAICYIVTRSLWFVAGIHWFWDFSWFYLGADGGASSSKIVDVTKNPEMLFYLDRIDAAMAIGVFLLLVFLTRRSFSKRKAITG